MMEDKDIEEYHKMVKKLKKKEKKKPKKNKDKKKKKLYMSRDEVTRTKNGYYNVKTVVREYNASEDEFGSTGWVRE